MKKRIVIGNWKMYVQHPDEAKKFASTLRKKMRLFSKVEVGLAPSFTLLPGLAAALKGSAVRTLAQTVSMHEDAPHTGNVSAAMLKAAGASASIVGHSERRAAGETDAMIRLQITRAGALGLGVVLCVGERERDAAGTYFGTVAGQLTGALKETPGLSLSKLIVAYEPVWAIGKSAQDAMKPAELQEMAIFIRKTLADILDPAAARRVPILYGGSVEPGNAAALLAEGGVAGFLIGHASAVIDSFIEILTVCQKN